MIFVTLGTQDKQFPRLLDAVSKQIENGNIKEEVIVQAGQTKYENNKMKIYDLIAQEDFENYIKKASVLITHGGVGNILTGISYNKKIIAAARLAEYNEHTNDHQVQIVEKFSSDGFILKLEDFDKLDEVLKKVKTFVPKKYINNNDVFCKKLKEEIDKL